MSDQLNPTPQPELSEQDAELLSAYLDAMLSDDERKQLEMRLEREPFLRSELASMRQTVTMIHALPTLKAPRNFTITAEDVAPDTNQVETQLSEKFVRFPTSTLWTLASVAAAIVVVLVGILVFLPSANESLAPADQSQGIAQQPTILLVSTELPATDGFSISNSARSETSDVTTDTVQPPEPAIAMADEAESDEVVDNDFDSEEADESADDAPQTFSAESAPLDNAPANNEELQTTLAFTTPTPSTLAESDDADSAGDSAFDAPPVPENAETTESASDLAFGQGGGADGVTQQEEQVQITDSIMRFINAMRRIIAEYQP
ncbi:MAG: hypothetical protein AAF846_14545 [Chloroflexota bacterium]